MGSRRRSYAFTDEEACELADLDPADVERIAARIARAAEDAKALGLCVFAGSGVGTLRLLGDHSRDGIVASLGLGHFDGGDGGD